MKRALLIALFFLPTLVWAADLNFEGIYQQVKKFNNDDVPFEDSKFKSQALTKTTGGYYQVIEYVTPDGLPGWQVIYYDSFKRAIGANGSGPETKERTYSFEYADDLSATSTIR